MHRRAILSSVVVGVGIVCLSILAATESEDAHDGDGQGGRFEVEVTDGQGRTPSANPRTAREREAWTQDETPEQARRRIDYLQSLEASRQNGSR